MRAAGGARGGPGEAEFGPWRVPAGAYIAITMYALHRHPQHWPDPERFDPERFSEENSVGRPKFAYFPFGGGNRLCIGEGFAWMEGVLVLATIGQRWKFRLANDKPVKPDPSFTLRPKGGLTMVAAAR